MSRARPIEKTAWRARRRSAWLWIRHRAIGLIQRGALLAQGKRDAADLLKRIATFGRISDMGVLDLGCGKNGSPISQQVLTGKFKELTSVDTYTPYLEELRQKPCASQHHTIIEAKLLDVVTSLPDSSVDVALLLDVLEHIELQEAHRLLEEIKRVTARGILIFLPLGECPQEEYDGNIYQIHRSTWYAANLRDLGFTVEELRWFHFLGRPPRPVSAAWAQYRHSNASSKEAP